MLTFTWLWFFTFKASSDVINQLRERRPKNYRE